jgi:effector-binding domain-containing protein
VSIKALRLYDEMGLLTPVHVDGYTGYRYYAYDQLPRLYRVMALKDLGFSLEQIGRLLKGELSAEQMRGMLKLRQAEIRQQVEEAEARLARVDVWLRQIEQEDSVSNYDVVIKNIAPTPVAAVHGIVPTPPDQRSLWDELIGYLQQKNARMIGPPMAIYHDPEFKEHNWDIEVVMPITDDLSPVGNVQVYELQGAEKMACVVHTGPFATILEAYDALAKWIGQNGYQIVGPGRELNLRLPEKPGDQHDPNTVNEIQLPVEKMG